MQTTLVLASTSVYRQQLLTKLNLPYISVNPMTDEAPHNNESAQQLVLRLAEQKALAGSQIVNDDLQHGKDKNYLVIGSDQVAVIDKQIIGKPLTTENAIKQLKQASGKAITFYTGLAVYNTQTNTMHSCIEPFTVHFRQLSLQQIEYYVAIEQPLYCAGSFKSEGLGIALFEKLQGDDPNSLIGLPLIKLIDLLAQHGMQVLATQHAD
ncbi:Maf family protein [Shewanella aestuarii]|uniref:7-methyl-GTP pyrophosphatase n=1 Tax=Shewanella aestuarii TaxID=1028752 RepID=A0A6G9QKD3_9GAMM|nr:Maf family protein [Shewanella aestuarii]QIR14329.1 septum formation inhibitor Maf [Shewanella aestuarii]